MKYKGKREQTTTRSKKNGKILTIMAIVMVLSCFAGGIYARYTRKEVIENNQVEAEAFYFTVDLIRDDTLTNVEKDYALYGGGEKEIRFNVWNYVDDLRVTKLGEEETLDYQFTIEYSGSSSYTSYQVVKGEEPITADSFKGPNKASNAYTLKIGNGYEDGKTLTLHITSSKPYAKTISLNFTLYTTQADLMYCVEDTIDSTTAKLIIMANVNIPANKIQLDMTTVNAEGNVLQVDMNDNDIWTANGSGYGPPVVPDGEKWLKTVYVTNEMKAGESLEILFFKAAPSKNYQTEPLGSGLENEPVKKEDNIYSIKLAEYTVSSGT